MTNILCMGDSITRGEGGGYRVPLRRMLHARARGCAFVGSREDDGAHEGYPGFRIRDLLEGKESQEYGTALPAAQTIERFRPDIVLLLLGTNDLYLADPHDAAHDLLQLLDAIFCATDRTRVLLGSLLPILPGPKPWDMTVPDDVTQRVRTFNCLLSEFPQRCGSGGARLFHADTAACVLAPQDLLPDGVHPTPALYAKLAACWSDALVAHGLID